MTGEHFNLIKRYSNELNNEQLTSLWYKYKNIKEISKLLRINIVNSTILVEFFRPLVLDEIVILAKNRDLTYPDIANEVGIGLRALRQWMKLFDLESKFDLPARPGARKRNDSYTETDLAYQFLLLQSINNLKKIFHSNGTTITNKLLDLGFITSHKIINRKKVINHIKHNGFSGNFTSLLLEIICGCLLGDGSIRNTSTFSSCLYSISEYKDAIKSIIELTETPYETIKQNLKKYIAIYNESAEIISSFPLGIFKYNVNIKEDDWVNFLKNMFEKAGIQVYGGVKAGGMSKINGREIQSGNSYWIESLASIELGKIETEWYVHENVHRVKVVPRSLKAITSNILLAWFVGDGTNNKGSIELYTMNFNEKDNEYLVKLLQDVGIKAKMNKKYDKRIDKFYFRIIIGRLEYKNFMNFLELANPELLNIAKNTFPWKFDKNLSFKEWKSR